MRVTAQIVEFPTPSALGLTLLLVVFGGMFGAAILLDASRRHKLVRAGAANQWKAVTRIIQERRLNPAEAETLRTIVKRHASQEPLAAVTTRSGYRALVDRAMIAYERTHTEKEYQAFGIQLRDIRIQLGLDHAALGQQIFSTREIEPGQWIDVAPVGRGEDWTQMMVEVVDEAYLHLVYKGDNLSPKLPQASQRVKCRMWRDEDGRYLFTSSVVAAETLTSLVLLCHNESLKRTQTREHFRVRHDQSTTVSVLSAALTDDTASLESRQAVTRLRGRITSLSAGGCALVVNQAVSKRMILRLQLDLPGHRALEPHAKIVSSASISGGRYLLRLEFVDPQQEAVDAIAKYVMHRQQRAIERQQQELV